MTAPQVFCLGEGGRGGGAPEYSTPDHRLVWETLMLVFTRVRH